MSYSDSEMMQLMGKLFQASPLPSKDLSKAWIYATSPDFQGFSSNEKTGKWCIFGTKDNIDGLWDKVKAEVQAGRLVLAKTSTAYGANFYNGNFVICVYTMDWSDEAALKQSRQVLREAGFTEPLKYKRDIETINGVYGGDNEYLLTM
jgi:hypothetical protein